MAPLSWLERRAAARPQGLLVLHHGRGTDERDLLGLADALDRERRLRVVTPRAPLRLPGSPGYHWYLAPRVGYPDHDSFHAARAALAELHDELWEDSGVGPERTVLGGFSMGTVTRALIAHGRLDPIIEVDFAHRARELLEAGGLDVTYRESDVGHQIDPAHLRDAAGWLDATLP